MEAENNYKSERRGHYITEAALKIGEAALTGMLYEVGTTLKPGLVTPISKGAHRDMNYFSFLRSSSSISRAMGVFAQLGFEYGEYCLPEIRKYGKNIEREMYEATGGVNTQKGLLFLGGIAAAAAGFCLKNSVMINSFNISNHCKLITEGIVERELRSIGNKEFYTSGERIYMKYGITGVRGEIEKGLPSISQYGLIYYREALLKGLALDNALTQSLIGIMTVSADTVVVNRAGMEGLDYVKNQANTALKLGGMYTTEGIDFIKAMDKDFIERNISPGGSADLLAITVMLDEIEKMNLY